MLFKKPLKRIIFDISPKKKEIVKTPIPLISKPKPNKGFSLRTSLFYR